MSFANHRCVLAGHAWIAQWDAPWIAPLETVCMPVDAVTRWVTVPCRIALAQVWRRRFWPGRLMLLERSGPGGDMWGGADKPRTCYRAVSHTRGNGVTREPSWGGHGRLRSTCQRDCAFCHRRRGIGVRIGFALDAHRHVSGVRSVMCGMRRGRCSFRPILLQPGNSLRRQEHRVRSDCNSTFDGDIEHSEDDDEPRQEPGQALTLLRLSPGFLTHTRFPCWCHQPKSVLAACHRLAS